MGGSEGLGAVHVYRVTSVLQLLALLTSLTTWIRTSASPNFELVGITGLGVTSTVMPWRLHWLLLLFCAAPKAYLAASEGALYMQQQVHCAPPFEAPVLHAPKFPGCA